MGKIHPESSGYFHLVLGMLVLEPLPLRRAHQESTRRNPHEDMLHPPGGELEFPNLVNIVHGSQFYRMMSDCIMEENQLHLSA